MSPRPRRWVWRWVPGSAARYLAARGTRATARTASWTGPRPTPSPRDGSARRPGTLTAAELARTAPAYARAMERIVPLLEQRLGAAMPGVVERHEVVDRQGWARANASVFRDLVDHLEAATLSGRRSTSPAASVAMRANRFLATRQVGFLLGYLGTRVLGQYDIALLSAEGAPGRLLFVEENIRATARSLGIPLDDFRTWIALHEATHAFELETHPWLRPYLRERLERQISGFLADAREIQAGGIRHVHRPLAGGRVRGIPGRLHVPRAARAAARDAAGDEPHGGLQRLGHGRGRRAGAARRREHPAAVRGASSPASPGRRPAHRPADRSRPEDGAVPAGRAVRGGRVSRPAAPRPSATCGMGPRRCPPTRRWTSRGGGSQRIVPARPSTTGRAGRVSQVPGS